MSIKEMKQYKRDAMFGALGAFLMLIGDLCLSVIPDKPKRQRIICKRGVSERLMGAMETSAADCNRSFRHGACFFLPYEFPTGKLSRNTARHEWRFL